MTADLGKCFSVTWSLADFTKTLFTLIPKAKLAGFEAKSAIYYGRCKIFLSKHLLGLTNDKILTGNIVTRQEINLFQLEHWLPDGTTPPKNTTELARMGEDIIIALEMMGLYPRSLSSPVKAYTERLNCLHFSTYRGMPDSWQPALDLALKIAKREWHSCYQVGYWNETFLYDIAGAYPSLLPKCRNTDTAIMEYAKTPPARFDFALLRGTIEVMAPISPLIHPSGVNPKGVWEDTFTSEEINFLEHWGLGTFKMQEGYFFIFTGIWDKPYKNQVEDLWAFRQSPNRMVQTISRRAAQGLSGLLDEEYPERRGDFYNPIFASMVRSRCRLKVADFIFSNNLLDDTIAVQVDSVLSSRQVPIAENGGLGEWRLKEQGPALVLGRGRIWRQSSRPPCNEIVKAFKTKPRATRHEVNGHSIDLVIPSSPDRKFREYPRNSGQALSRIYKSEPLEVGMGNKRTKAKR